MKKILYMAITPNGYIAEKDGSTNWSEEEWKNYIEKVNEIGNIVVGRKTFDIMKKYSEFEKMNNPYIFVISNSTKKTEIDNLYITNSIEKIIKKAKEKGFSKILISGGAKINSLFLGKDFIDEIFLDIEPMIFGEGIKIFFDIEKKIELELLEVKKISNNSIQVHYKVKK